MIKICPVFYIHFSYYIQELEPTGFFGSGLGFGFLKEYEF
jgi:hypothetical protein